MSARLTLLLLLIVLCSCVPREGFAQLDTGDVSPEERARILRLMLSQDPEAVESLSPEDLELLESEEKIPDKKNYLNERFFKEIPPPEEGTEESAPSDQETSETEYGEGYYGYSFFSKAPALSNVNENRPSPENYKLGPGDEVIIDIWGEADVRYKSPLSKEGTFKIPKVGVVHLGGLKLSEAKARIKTALAKAYSGLVPKTGEEQRTFLDVSLGKLRTVSVYVVGEVRNPGSYILPPHATLLHALLQSGGPSLSGTMRDIQLVRKGKKVARLDMYQYFRQGHTHADIRLEDGDVLIVGVYQARTTLKGGFKLPMTFEMKNEGETFWQVMNYAGGFREGSWRDRVRVRRITDKKRQILTLPASKYKEFLLKGGDVVEADAVQAKFIKKVIVRGAVENPGAYEIEENMRLKDLIEKAKGLRQDAFIGRSALFRRTPSGGYQATNFHLGRVLSGAGDNALLQEGDSLVVKNKEDVLIDRFVFINGEVQSPGRYLYHEGMTVEDLILEAGGLLPHASNTRIELARVVGGKDMDWKKRADVRALSVEKNLSISEASQHVQLQAYDKVSVRKKKGYAKIGTVELRGEVLYPGVYALEKSQETLYDVLKRAGGLSPNAYPAGGYIIRTFSDNLFDKDSLGISQKMTQSYISAKIDQAIRKPSSRHNVMLQSGDIIQIPSYLQEVRVRGAVLSPIAIMYQPQLSFKDCVRMAGGYKRLAQHKDAYIKYPNGSSRTVRRMLFFRLYPRVQPGAVIVVPHRLIPKRVITPQEWIAISGGVSTLTLVIINIFDRLQN